MKTMRSRTGPVFQKAFRIERLRKPADPAATAQAKQPPRSSPDAPRPDLLPARMRGPAAQAKVERPRTPADRPGAVLPGKPVAQRAQWIEMVDMSLQLRRKKLIHVVASGAGLSHGTCIQKHDRQLVEVGHPHGEKNAYYLPWEDGGCTEATVTLEPPLKYFFTAPLSGCSIWCKYLDGDRIVIRHEASTKPERYKQHLRQGFHLVFNSHEAGKWGFSAPTLKVEQSKTQIRKLAIDFLIYAAVEEVGMTFYVQERRTLSTTNTQTDQKQERRELVRELSIPVLPL